MDIKKYPFGITAKKESVDRYVLTNQNGCKVELITYGAAIKSIYVPDRDGVFADIALGFDTIQDYEAHNSYMGAIIGRCANRIENSQFLLNGVSYSLFANDGPNHLHGGRVGFDKKVWTATIHQDGVTFSLISPDGEEGYPGTLHTKVTYTLSDENQLILRYEAHSNEDTIVNLTNHCYFNLAGHQNGNALQQTLQIFSDMYTENNSQCLPTGVISSVEGTPMDFRTPKPIEKDINSSFFQLKNCHGYDHNWILSSSAGEMKKAAILHDTYSGRALEVSTTMPGIQFYSGNFLDENPLGKQGVRYQKHSGICLETQFFPNALCHPSFPSPILRANETYQHTTVFHFFIK